MEKVTKEQANAAIAAYKEADRKATALAAEMKAHKAKVETYAREHVGDFVDKDMVLENGKISLVAGAAKPLRDGKPLKKEDKIQLAKLLPGEYVAISIDCAALFASDDKKVRHILNAAGVQIVKEDNYKIS